MGLEYLHQLNIPHGELKGVRMSPPTDNCRLGFPFNPRFIVLTPLPQANVVVDQNGRARLTEYGLAPISSDPGFTAFATYECLGNSRWSAPELMKPSHKGKVTTVRESKAADIFSFGMLAVEVFTGKIPFVEQANQEVVFQILGGVRPKTPENAQEVGLTAKMWELIESCWLENPKKRPTIGEVVVRWRKFVDNVNDNSDVCVRIVTIFDSIRDDLLMIHPGKLNLGQDWQQIPADERGPRLRSSRRSKPSTSGSRAGSPKTGSDAELSDPSDLSSPSIHKRVSSLSLQ